MAANSVETRSPAPDEDADTALPAVGRVWEGSGPTSIFAAFKNKARPPARPADRDNVIPVSDDFADLMSRFLDAAGRQQPTAAVFLEGGRIIDRDGGTVTVELPLDHAPAAAMLERNNRRENLQQVLSDLLGTPTGLKIAISETSSVVESNVCPAPERPRTGLRQATEPEPAVPAQQGIAITEDLRIEILQNVPLAKAIAEQLGGRIVKVE